MSLIMVLGQRVPVQGDEVVPPPPWASSDRSPRKSNACCGSNRCQYKRSRRQRQPGMAAQNLFRTRTLQEGGYEVTVIAGSCKGISGSQAVVNSFKVLKAG